MSSKTQSERSSTDSFPLPRSLIVSKVSISKDETWLFNDLNANYAGVKKVSRNHDADGYELSSIRVDFESEDVVSEILNDNIIYINDREYYIRSYWPRKCYRCDNEGHVAAECPQHSLPEWRLVELLQEQKTNFERLINGFENKWNTRLLELKTSKNTNNTELVPIVNELTTVCQQFNQQNLQMQKQLSTITNRLQNTQVKMNN